MKAQSQEIRYLSTLLKQQQEVLAKALSKKEFCSRKKTLPSHCSKVILVKVRQEAFNVLPGGVIVRQGTSYQVQQVSKLTQEFSATWGQPFDDMLSEEAIWT